MIAFIKFINDSLKNILFVVPGTPCDKNDDCGNFPGAICDEYKKCICDGGYTAGNTECDERI